MIERTRFAVNRITCPSLSLEDFFRFVTQELGLTKVEIRNDLPGVGVTDRMTPAEAAEAARRHGIRILSINGMQKFNLKALQDAKLGELEKTLDVAAALHCTALVMCPNNDTADHRDARSRVEETVSALAAFGPIFMRRGVQGWVEPLGFPESSLSSIVVAGEAVKRSAFGCYRVVYDTFHHYLGPDTERDVDAEFASRVAGLIHVSGVESDTPRNALKDGHRVLVSASDRMKSREQVARMVSLGYKGDISFEPFSSDVQAMSTKALSAALNKSIEYLAAV